VQKLHREYKPGEIKNKNQLPETFIEKYIEYSSNKNDLIMDPFCGGFTTARTALKLERRFVGFELNTKAYNTFLPTLG
jgi:site-specific DNA-methyltransferase (adenine-specific)